MNRVNLGIVWVAVVAYGAIGMATSHCTHAQAWVATGESITALGETFAATGEAMDAALASGDISKETHEKWLAFARRFGPVYGAAHDLWLASEKNLDRSSAVAAGSILAGLAADLAGWTKVVNEAH